MTTTNTNTTYTQTQALAYLIEHAAADTPDGVMEAARKLLATKSKKYTKANTPSKTQLLNNSLAHEMVDVIARMSAPATAKAVCDAWDNPDVRSAQKVVAVARVAEAQGLIKRVINDKKQTCYIVC